MKWSTHVIAGEHIVAMGEEFVVYETTSGSTHLLGYVAGQILLHLAQSPADLPTLAANLASHLQHVLVPDFEQGMVVILNELQALDLVECA